jgi:hypothetical protein
VKECHGYTQDRQPERRIKMMQRFKLIRAAGVACISLVVMSLTSTGGQNPPSAVVVSSQGYVDVKASGTEKFVPLVEGMGLTVGDIVQTDSEAKVVLGLPDKSTLIIGENSRVVIRELGMVEVTKVSVSTFEIIKGKIRAIVNPFVTKESSFMIKTNNATVGVRGTDFGEEYDPDTDRTYILGLEDCVSLTLAKVPGSPPLLVCAGDELAILGGRQPGAPTKASDETINGFLEEMSTAGEPGTAEETNPPYIMAVFINRVINLQDVDGTLTLTQDDLSMDKTVLVSGTAADEAYTITDVEVSLDRGTTWEKASGTTNWSYEFKPQARTEYELMVRAKNEKGAVSDPGELGSWIIVYQDESYESIARSMIDKLFAAVTMGDSSAENLFSDYYDGVIDNIYTKSDVVDRITSSTKNVTAGYTINQVNSTGDAIIASINWTATVDGKKDEGSSKFWLAKSDEFRFTHSEGTWFLKSSRMPEIKLEIVSSIYGPPCENALRILLVVPGVPASVPTVTVYPITTCESTHFAILTRTFFEDITGETDGFGGDFHYEKTTGCTASGGPPCAGTMPFLYQSLNPLVTVNYTDYGYNLSASTMLPAP